MNAFRNKHAQISLFVIIALIIVLGIGIFFLLRPEIRTINPEVQEIHNFVQGCVEKTAEDAVYQIGETGGYFYSPNLSTENKIAYYYLNEEFFLPSKEKIENELENYVTTMIYFCTKNFESFPEYKITAQKMDSEATIGNENVLFSINYPISVQKDEQIFTLKTFSYTVDSRLGEIHNFISEIEESQKKEKNGWCINCITESAEKYDMYVHLKDYDDETIIFYVIDERSRVKEDAYIFKFAHRYEK